MNVPDFSFVLIPTLTSNVCALSQSSHQAELLKSKSMSLNIKNHGFETYLLEAYCCWCLVTQLCPTLLQLYRL